MPRSTVILILLSVLLLFPGPAGADTWNKKTNVNFHEPVELPGGIVLPPGGYVMKLLDSPSNRHIVQVLSADERKVHATILAIPNQRMKPAERTVISFYETPSGAPLFMRAWFYPGDTVGQEFAYPRDRAYQIARATGLKVPIQPEEPGEEVAGRDSRPGAASSPPPARRAAVIASAPSAGTSTDPFSWPGNGGRVPRVARSGIPGLGPLSDTGMRITESGIAGGFGAIRSAPPRPRPVRKVVMVILVRVVVSERRGASGAAALSFHAPAARSRLTSSRGPRGRAVENRSTQGFGIRISTNSVIR